MLNIDDPTMGSCADLNTSITVARATEMFSPDCP